MHKRRLALLVFAAVGCFSDPVGISTTRGEWKLETVNGNPLPFTLSGSGANKTELVSDVLFLYEGFTYDETITIRTTVNGEATNSTTKKGWSYSISLGALIFGNNEGLPSKYGKVDANKMTIAEPDFVRVFTK